MFKINKIILNKFQQLEKIIKINIDHVSGKERLKHTYRLNAIQTVIKFLEKYEKKITSGEDLKYVKGVGKGTIDRINEIIKTGTLKELDDNLIDEKYLDYIDKLKDVFGIGRKKAYELYVKYGIKNINDLKKHLKKSKEDIPDNIAKGIKYYGKIKENIPHIEITKMEKILLETLKDIDKKLIGVVCGSYRRNTKTSGDIDFIIIKPKGSESNVNYLELFVKELRKNKFIIDSLTSENVRTKYMGLCKLPNKPIRRIDIRFIPYESYDSALLYFTGPRDLNKKMRSLAIEMGYKLNEYGLYNEKGKRFNTKSEKDIFKLLSLEYLEPYER